MENVVSLSMSVEKQALIRRSAKHGGKDLAMCLLENCEEHKQISIEDSAKNLLAD